MSEDAPQPSPPGKNPLKLVVFFNHRFERNIPRLREYYKTRFSRLQFICPFYRGEDPDVSSVYDSSARFQNFFVQARHDYLSGDCSHYVFVADDLILNPALNENNLLRELGLDGQTAFLPHVTPLHQVTFEYYHLLPALHAVGGTHFVHHKPELPAYSEALERLARHGVRLDFLGLCSLRGHGNHWTHYPDLWKAVCLVARHRARRLWDTLRGRTPRPSIPSYPIVNSYSDFFVVPAQAMDDFLHYCGVFSAMDLFVEFALPTALLLAAERIRTARDTAYRLGNLYGVMRDSLLEQNGRCFSRLLESFPADVLFYHPVKLSQWT